jgi:hypothetical protein
MVEKAFKSSRSKQIIANDSVLKLTSVNFQGAYPKISTSTLVLKQTKENGSIIYFQQNQKRQLLKLRFQKTDNLFRGKNQNR